MIIQKYLDLTIEELEAFLRKASWYYYNDPANTLISDPEYDILLNKLKEINPDSVIFKEIGAPPKEGGIKHLRKMFSLDNAFNMDDFYRFLDKFTFREMVVTPKLDGASVELIYRKGRLISASTRGNGIFGDDITSVMKAIVPNEVNFDSLLQVVGEVVISFGSFEAFSSEYSNPRNLAAGSLMTKDNPNILIERNAIFIPYDIYSPDLKISTYESKLMWLKAKGFNPLFYAIFINDAQEFIDQFYRELMDYPYPTDGIVIRVNNLDLEGVYGYSHKAPKFAIALKHKTESAEVIIRNIRWDISKNGILTPVAEIDPVDLEGAKITNITLHNAKIYFENKLGIGAKIEITRSGGVIPKYLGTIEPAEPTLPEVCPYCGGDISTDGVKLYCTNGFACKPQLVDFIDSFLEKLDFKGLSIKSIEKLVKVKVDNIGDFFGLASQDFQAILGYSSWHADRVKTDLDKLKRVDYYKLLYASNIDMLGKVNARAFSEKITFKELLDNLNNFDNLYDLVSKVFGYGETSMRVSTSLFKSFKVLIRLLLDQGFEIVENHTQRKDISFVITGTLSKPRKEFQKLIEEKGYIYQSSITRDTTYLVAGDNIGANKIAKAKKYGIKVIDEYQFMEVING